MDAEGRTERDQRPVLSEYVIFERSGRKHDLQHMFGQYAAINVDFNSTWNQEVSLDMNSTYTTIVVGRGSLWNQQASVILRSSMGGEA